MEESQINVARTVAKAGGHENAFFHVGDVIALPFKDNFFDVAHWHAVLMHVPDTTATLAEVKRVLKPGGIIASREMFVSCSFLSPKTAEWTMRGRCSQTCWPLTAGTLKWVRNRETSFFKQDLTTSVPGLPLTSSVRRKTLSLFTDSSATGSNSRCYGSGYHARSCHPGAVRKVAQRVGPLEGPSRCLWRLRLRPRNRLQA